MKIAILTGSPNKDGLTAACGRAAAQGAAAAGAETVCFDLHALAIVKCRACGEGWGTCFERHVCQAGDAFPRLHGDLAGCDAFVLVSPVYWGEMSEAAKAFCDRLRRCEAFLAMRENRGLMYARPFIGVAAAGGSGNGAISCLESMERFGKHMGADIFDLIAITRKSRPYKLEAIGACLEEVARRG